MYNISQFFAIFNPKNHVPPTQVPKLWAVFGIPHQGHRDTISWDFYECLYELQIILYAKPFNNLFMRMLTYNKYSHAII
jgi:hypothetical protein